MDDDNTQPVRIRELGYNYRDAFADRKILHNIDLDRKSVV